MTQESPSARLSFRVQTQVRTGFDNAPMHDVHLQVAETGTIIWAHSFSDESAAEERRREIEEDLENLSVEAFRRKWSVPSST